MLLSKIDYNQLVSFFSSYVNSLLFLIMMVAMLIHAKLGCETIIEDYISSLSLKKNTINSVRIIFYGAIIITVISLLSILSKA